MNTTAPRSPAPARMTWATLTRRLSLSTAILHNHTETAGEVRAEVTLVGRRGMTRTWVTVTRIPSHLRLE